MASTRVMIGGAAASAIGVRVARSLYSRWRLLPEADRARIAAFAEDTKEKALSLRGSSDRLRAEDDLRASSETLAAALVETAESDSEAAAEDVQRLREDLRRELARLANADIKASRTEQDPASGPK
jgi:hypothetical protein